MRSENGILGSWFIRHSSAFGHTNLDTLAANAQRTHVLASVDSSQPGRSVLYSLEHLSYFLDALDTESTMPSAAASDPTKIEPGAEPRATLRNAVAVAELLPMKLLFTILGFARAGGYLDEADELLEAVERRGGEQVRLIEERARIAYARGDNEQALALLTLRHDRSPSATASIAIARLYLETGALDEARAISEELSASQGHLVTVKQLAADVARASGDSELARSHLLALVDERGEHPPSLLSLAQLSLDDRDVESAAAFFRRATVDAENLNANQLLQASGVAAAIGEQTLADAFRDQADSFQHQRSHALIREIEAAVHAVPKPNVVPHQPEPRTRAIPKPAKAKREHTVALHVEQGSLVPDDPRVIQVLHEDFGHERLRPGQSAVIANVLAGLDTLAIMPTGVGKSLTFQLPAMLDECTTVVISPLIALMKDQVESLPDGIRS